MKRGRLARRAIVFLLLGAAANVAVAWACAFQLHPWLMLGRRNYDRDSSSDLGCGTMMTVRLGQTTITQYSGHGPSGLFRSTVLNEEEYRSIIPSWSRFAAAEPCLQLKSAMPDSTHIVCEQTGFGWPMRSMTIWRSVQLLNSGARLQENDAIQLVDGSGTLRRLGLSTELPRRVAAGGFAFNTAFYAALAWLLWKGHVAQVRWQRRRRGLCPDCAYPTGATAACSECGRPMTLGSIRFTDD